MKPVSFYVKYAVKTFTIFREPDEIACNLFRGRRKIKNPKAFLDFNNEKNSISTKYRTH